MTYVTYISKVTLIDYEIKKLTEAQASVSFLLNCM